MRFLFFRSMCQIMSFPGGRIFRTLLFITLTTGKYNLNIRVCKVFQILQSRCINLFPSCQWITQNILLKETGNRKGLNKWKDIKAPQRTPS